MKPAESPTKGRESNEAPPPGAEMELKEKLSHKGVERKTQKRTDPESE
jgi:hypothetical protein